MSIFLLMSLILFVILLGVGIALGLAALALFAVLAAAGVVSLSVVIGFARREAGAGFRALFLQLGALAGLFCGAAAGGLLVWLAGWQVEWWLGALCGAAAGVGAGLLVAALFNLAWGRLLRWLAAKWERVTTAAGDPGTRGAPATPASLPPPDPLT